MARKAKPFIAKAIKRPGRLTTAAKRAGRSILAQARVWAKSPDKSKRGAANLYLNVLRPLAQKRRKK